MATPTMNVSGNPRGVPATMSVAPTPHEHGNPNGNPHMYHDDDNMNGGAHPNRPRPFYPPPAPTAYGLGQQQSWPVISPGCPPVGAPNPNPCRPYMDPRQPQKVYGCQLPCDKMRCDTVEEAVKQLCWVETTLRSPAAVPAGDTITFDIEVKWWLQFQKVQNLGDQVNATFDLTQIRYGQSNYSVELEELRVNGVGVPQNGIDIRRWNQTNFVDKFYPFPALGLNDPLTLEFTNITGADADLELLLGGPAVLQIG